MIPLLLLMTMDREDDRLFMEGVYQQYHALMYGMALRVTRDRTLAEDAVSDALVSLIKKISVLRSLECNKLRSYVVITVRHAAISLLKARRREPAAGDEALINLEDGFRVDEGAMSRAGVEEIKRAVRALPPRERDVMLMRYFREMTDEEIAREMGIQAVSVRVELTRARKHLAATLGKEGR